MSYYHVAFSSLLLSPTNHQLSSSTFLFSTRGHFHRRIRSCFGRLWISGCSIWRGPWPWRSVNCTVNCSQLTTTAPFHLSYLSTPLSASILPIPYPHPWHPYRFQFRATLNIPRKFTYFPFKPKTDKVCLFLSDAGNNIITAGKRSRRDDISHGKLVGRLEAYGARDIDRPCLSLNFACQCSGRLE